MRGRKESCVLGNLIGREPGERIAWSYTPFSLRWSPPRSPCHQTQPLQRAESSMMSVIPSAPRAESRWRRMESESGEQKEAIQLSDLTMCKAFAVQGIERIKTQSSSQQTHSWVEMSVKLTEFKYDVISIIRKPAQCILGTCRRGISFIKMSKVVGW